MQRIPDEAQSADRARDRLSDDLRSIRDAGDTMVHEGKRLMKRAMWVGLGLLAAAAVGFLARQNQSRSSLLLRRPRPPSILAELVRNALLSFVSSWVSHAVDRVPQLPAARRGNGAQM